MSPDLDRRDDRIVGTTVVLLETRGAHEAASFLEMARVEPGTEWDSNASEEFDDWSSVTLYIDPLFHDDMYAQMGAITEAVRTVVGYPHGDVKLRVEVLPAGWREARQAEQGFGVTNQGARVPAGARVINYRGHKYHDAAEVAVAKMLEEIIANSDATDSISFSPNAPVVTRHRPYTVDFLVYGEGRVGIIEVDGDTHHRRFVADASKDEHLREHGIELIIHIPAEDTSDPAKLRPHLDRFIRRLRKR